MGTIRCLCKCDGAASLSLPSPYLCLAQQTSWVHSLPAPHPLKHALQGPGLFNTAPLHLRLAPWAPFQVPRPAQPSGLTISQEHDDILSHVGVEILKPQGIFQGLLSLVSPVLGVFLFLCTDSEGKLFGKW